MSSIQEKPNSNNVLTKLYSYLTKSPEIDQEYLTEILLGSQKRNLAENTLEILQTADLSKIDLLPILKICFQKELNRVEFELLYQTIINSAIPHLSFRSLMMIHQYINDHPELQSDDLLIRPFDAKTGAKRLDLSSIEPVGPINYLINSENLPSEEQIPPLPPKTLLLSSAKDDHYLLLLVDIAENFPNIVVAGGYPTNVVDGTFDKNPQSDLDIFILGDSNQTRKTTLDNFLTQFQTFIKPEEFFYQINASVVNIWFENSQIRPQIILSQAPSLYHLLNNFDMQFNSWAYYPFEQNFVGILQSYYALRTRTTFVNGSRIAPIRLVKAYYKKYSVIKYRPFCFSHSVVKDQLAPEYITEKGLNLDNLLKIKTEQDYHYNYWVGNCGNSHQKNYYDLVNYYPDLKDQIKSSKLNGPIDSKKINLNGIKSNSGYNTAADRSAYSGIDLSNPPKLDLTTELKFVETTGQYNNLKTYRLNQNFAGQTGPLKSFGLFTNNSLHQHNQDEDIKFRYIMVEVPPSELQTYLNMIDQLVISQFVDKYNDAGCLKANTSLINQTRINGQTGEIDQQFPNSYRFKATEDFKAYDINGNEIEPIDELYDAENPSYVIVDISDIRLYQSKIRRCVDRNMVCLYISRLQFC